jgi:HK97 gp10 family phage protein
VQLRFEGGKQLADALATLSTSVSRKVQVESLTAAAEPIRLEATTLAPRSDGPGPHLADNIVIGSIGRAALDRRDRGSETVVEVGPSMKPDDLFYGFFQEFGTARHGAQPFMRPAFDGKARQSLGLLHGYLWHAIRKRIPSLRK